MKFLSYKDLRERGITYSKMHLGRLMRAGKFPRSVKLNDAPNSPNVWNEVEIDEHQARRLAARDAAAAAARAA